MPSIGTNSKPAYVYDAGTDTWIPIGPGEHTHDYIGKDVITTTGDIIYASAANTPARRGIGSTGQVLTVSGGVPTWATPAGGGKVLQVVHAETSTQVVSSLPGGTFTDTTLTATITPSAASSKVLALVTHNGNWRSNGNQNNSLALKLFRGTTEIGKTGGINWIWPGATPVIQSITGSAGFNILDTPNTTSPVIYKTQFCNINNSAEAGVQYSFGGTWATTSYITLLEIGA